MGSEEGTSWEAYDGDTQVYAAPVSAIIGVSFPPNTILLL